MRSRLHGQEGSPGQGLIPRDSPVCIQPWKADWPIGQAAHRKAVQPRPTSTQTVVPPGQASAEIQEPEHPLWAHEHRRRWSQPLGEVNRVFKVKDVHYRAESGPATLDDPSFAWQIRNELPIVQHGGVRARRRFNSNSKRPALDPESGLLCERRCKCEIDQTILKWWYLARL